MVKNKIGIMQGRLSLPVNGRIQSFPKQTWKEEFDKAKTAGLDHIEWIFESDEWEKNPISSDSGILEITSVMQNTGVKIVSLCADYFMDIPYLSSNENTRKDLREMMVWLVNQCSKIGASYIDIPFVDASKINHKSEYPFVREFILPAAIRAADLKIKLALETSLGPSDFAELLNMVGHQNVVANYDTGNSSGIGYNCVEEISSYGSWIATLHIKDRLLNNGTKPLGKGSADFHSFFSNFSKLNFQGPIVLQAAREEDGREIDTAIKNRKFVEHYLERYSLL